MNSIEIDSEKLEEALDRLISIDRIIIDLQSKTLEFLFGDENKFKEHLQESDKLNEKREIISNVVKQFSKPKYGEIIENYFEIEPSVLTTAIAYLSRKGKKKQQRGVTKRLSLYAFKKRKDLPY